MATAKTAKKLTDVEQFYFDSNYDKIPLPTLSDALGRQEKFLQKLIDQKKPEALPAAEPPKQTKSKKDPTQFERNMGWQRNTDGTKKKNGPVVMTPGASEIADDFYKASSSEPYLSERLTKSIFKIRSDE